MNLKKVIKEVESNAWWTEEFPGHLGLCMHFMNGFARLRNQISLKVHSVSALLCENGKMREETKEDEKIKIFFWLLDKMKKDSKFMNMMLKKHKIVIRNLLEMHKKIEKTNLSKITNKQLWQLYNKFFETWVVFCEVELIPEAGDSFLEHYLIPLLKEKEKIPQNEINELVVVLSTPFMYSFMDRAHLDFLKLCLSYLKSKNNFRKNLKRHVKKYFWIRNNYSNAYYLDERYFMENVKKETSKKSEKDLENEIKRIKEDKSNLKKRKIEFRRRYKLSKETKLIFNIYEKMGVWIDERKENMMKSIHYASMLLKEVAKRNNLEWIEIMYYTVPEIKKLLLENKKLPKEELKSRFDCSAYVTTYEEKVLFTGNDAKRIIEAFDKKISREIVKGIVANKANGNLIGEVCVIIDPNKEEFPEGKILVTTMTRPDFVPLIKKAKAIITDEGGITCHAAVVSREFGIPCIIGTRNGTRMLKTGDKVEIDTEKGIVRKL